MCSLLSGSLPEIGTSSFDDGMRAVTVNGYAERVALNGKSVGIGGTSARQKTDKNMHKDVIDYVPEADQLNFYLPSRASYTDITKFLVHHVYLMLHRVSHHFGNVSHARNLVHACLFGRQVNNHENISALVSVCASFLQECPQLVWLQQPVSHESCCHAVTSGSRS